MNITAVLYYCCTLIFIGVLSQAVTDEEIKSMSVGQLKKLLESKGVPCKDCVQREDFVEIALGLKDHSDIETAENKNNEKKAEKAQKESSPIDVDALKAQALVYLGKMKEATSQAFENYARLAIKYSKIYGPKAQEMAKVYAALAKENGLKYSKIAFEHAQIYGELGFKYGKIYSARAAKRAEEFYQKTKQQITEMLEQRAKAQ